MSNDAKDLMTDTPTPLSSRMNWPLLSHRTPNVDLGRVRATPFSDSLGLPLLSSSQGSATELKTDDPTPLSRMFNWPLLSGSGPDRDETPLSSRFGWPLLSRRAANVALMTDNPTPLSSALNLPLLSEGSTAMGGTDTGSASNPVAKFIRQVVTGEVQR